MFDKIFPINVNLKYLLLMALEGSSKPALYEGSNEQSFMYFTSKEVQMMSCTLCYKSK